MSRSTGCWLGVVGGEVAWWAVEAVVEGDGGGQGEEFGGQARAKGVEFSGAVVFEAEHVLGGLKDALDALADRGEVRSAAGFVFAAGANDQGAQAGGVG